MFGQTDPKSPILIVAFPPEEKQASFPFYFVISFPPTAMEDIARIAKGDVIEFQGNN